MPEYIERDIAFEAIAHGAKDSCDTLTVYEAQDRIDAVPAADVVEVRHGRWIDTGYENSTGPIYWCSVCDSDWNPNERDVELKRMAELPDYCPNCGAKMDGGADHAAD